MYYAHDHRNLQFAQQSLMLTVAYRDDWTLETTLALSSPGNCPRVLHYSMGNIGCFMQYVVLWFVVKSSAMASAYDSHVITETPVPSREEV